MKMTNLKMIRMEKGLSQGQLEIKSGISIKTIQEYEQQRRDINLARVIIVKRLAKALGCKIEALLEEEKKEEKTKEEKAKGKEGEEEKVESNELRVRKMKE